MDDANDAAGEGGACPGHDWHPHFAGWHLVPGTLRLMREYRCPYCDGVLLLGPGQYVDF